MADFYRRGKTSPFKHNLILSISIAIALLTGCGSDADTPETSTASAVQPTTRQTPIAPAAPANASTPTAETAAVIGISELPQSASSAASSVDPTTTPEIGPPAAAATPALQTAQRAAMAVTPEPATESQPFIAERAVDTVPSPIADALVNTINPTAAPESPPTPPLVISPPSEIPTANQPSALPHLLKKLNEPGAMASDGKGMSASQTATPAATEHQPPGGEIAMSASLPADTGKTSKSDESETTAQPHELDTKTSKTVPENADRMPNFPVFEGPPPPSEVSWSRLQEVMQKTGWAFHPAPDGGLYLAQPR